VLPLLAPAAAYFLAVMAAGFIFGAVREFVLVPSFSRAPGELLEAPLMLAAIWASARLTVRSFAVPPGLTRRLTMGALSLVLVLAAEMLLSPFVRGSVQAWFDSFTPSTLAIAILLWLAHLMMPVLVQRDGVALRPLERPPKAA
jgi:hypothetical protein